MFTIKRSSKLTWFFGLRKSGSTPIKCYQKPPRVLLLNYLSGCDYLTSPHRIWCHVRVVYVSSPQTKAVWGPQTNLETNMPCNTGPNDTTSNLFNNNWQAPSWRFWRPSGLKSQWAESEWATMAKQSSWHFPPRQMRALSFQIQKHLVLPKALGFPQARNIVMRHITRNHHKRHITRCSGGPPRFPHKFYGAFSRNWRPYPNEEPLLLNSWLLRSVKTLVFLWHFFGTKLESLGHGCLD